MLLSDCQHRSRRFITFLVLLGYLMAGAWAVYAQAPPPPPAEASSAADHEDSGHMGAAEDHTGHDLVTPPPPARPRLGVGQVFSIDFMQRALVAGLLVSGFCAYLGIYVVLRRIVFVGVALAEMSSAGVAMALLTGLAPMLGSAGVMLAGVGLISVPWAPRKVRQDAFIGIGYVVAAALAVLLLAKSAQGEAHLLTLLFGNIVVVNREDILATAAALGAVLLVHILFAKELLFVSFDPDTAEASGYNGRFWEAALFITIGLAIAFAIHAVGVLVTFASLIIPAVTALLLTRRMRSAFLVAVLVGMLPVPVGLYLSFVEDLPAAATIVAVSFVLLLIGGAVSRLRVGQ